METQQETTTGILGGDDWAKEYIKRYLKHFVLWDWKQIVIFVILSFLLVGVYNSLVTTTTAPITGILVLISILIACGLYGYITFKTAIIILLIFLLIGVILLIRDKFF